MLAVLFLLTAATAPAASKCHAMAKRADVALHAADEAGARGDYRSANKVLDSALDTLGNAYAAPSANDDTGMHLVLARERQRRGQPRQAAALKRSILLERVALCGRPGDAGPSRRR